MINTIIFIAFIILGACVGSFLTMAIYRIPLNKDMIFLSSHCPNCGKKLKIKSLIPILSYVLQFGKCLECGKKISIIYPLVETINCIAYGLIYNQFSFSFRSLFLGVLFSVIFLIMIIDLRYLEIPSIGMIALSVLAMLFIIFNKDINALYAFISAVLYFVFIRIAVVILEYKFPSKEFLGGGDEKLSIICGAFLTMKYVGTFYILTGLLGTIFGFIWKTVTKKEQFPFAPAMLISLFTIVVYMCNKM